MDKNRKVSYNQKRDKGAITLFVLLACLFFTFMLTGIYFLNVNRMQVQEQEVQQIKDNYAREIALVDEIYERLSKSVILKIDRDPEGWTNGNVLLTGKGDGKNVEIEEYTFHKEGEEKNWQEATETEKQYIEKDLEVTENGTYVLEVKDKDGKIYREEIVVKEIDRTPPTAGTIIATIKNAEDKDELYQYNTYTPGPVKIEKSDGKDGESGHKITVMTIYKDGEEYLKDIEGPIVELTEDGYYEVIVRTEDNAGNTAEREHRTIFVGEQPEIDRAVKATIEPDTWTNGNVIVTLEKTAPLPGQTIWYKETEAGTWKEYTNPIIVRENEEIYVRLEDVAGNKTNEKEVKITNIDKLKPTVAVYPTKDEIYRQQKEIAITLADNGDSGFKANQDLEYGWSISNTTQPTEWQKEEGTNALGTPAVRFDITKEDGTGTYYLWVKGGTVEDQATNVNDVTVFGPYNFDNLAPIVEVVPTQDTTYTKAKDINVTIEDQGKAGFHEHNKLTYGWSTSNTVKPSESEYNDIVGTNAENATTLNYTITNDQGTGTYYLWIKEETVKDKAENKPTLEPYGPYYFDNEAPIVELANEARTDRITVTVNATDTHSGVDTNSYRYYIKEENGTYGTPVIDGPSHTFTGLTQETKYIVKVEVSDKVANKTTTETDPIKTGTVPDANDEITSTINPEGWTNQNVTVTLSTTTTYKIEYRIASGVWTDYTTPIVLEENNVISARLKDDNGNTGKIKIINVTNIDKVKPQITNLTSTTNSITITATDDASGIIGYQLTTTNTAPTTFKDVENTKTFSRTETRLQQNTTYYVWVKDEAGNISLSSTVDTGEVTGLNTGNTTFTPVPAGWTNGTVRVTASTTVTGFTLQTSKNATNWQDTPIQDFTQNGPMYARLWDGTNAGEYTSYNVKNIDTLEPYDFIPSISTTTSSITVTAAATDREATTTSGCSGVTSYRFSNDGGTTYTGWQTSGTHEFTGLDRAHTYTILVQAKDAAGNITTGTIVANTDSNYTVEHYIMKTDGTYNSTATSTETKTGTTGGTITLADLKKTTSEYNLTNAIYYDHGEVGGATTTTTTILQDESRVVKLYYARTYGTLTTVKGANIASITTQNAVRYYYGATVPNLTATLSTATGYTITFNRWTSSHTSIISNKTTATISSFTWPAMANGTAITLTASGTKTANTYTLTYNYNNATGGNTTPSKTVTYDDNYGTLPAATRSYTITYHGNEGTVTQATQTATYTLDGWYKTATFTNKVTSTTKVTTASNHTIHAKWVDGEVTTPTATRVGYTFVGWYNDEDGTTKIADGNAEYAPTSNIDLYAKWEPNGNTEYKVEHYLMNTNGTYPSTATSTETKNGTTASSITLADLKKTTEEYNLTNAIIYDHGEVGGTTETTTTILADGSRVVKLYYRRTYGTLKTVAGTNVASVTTQNAVRYYYGAEVPSLTATPNTEAGYTITFNKWTSNSTYLTAPTSNPTGTFTWPAMPENTAVILTASATKTPKTNTAYKVEHYLMNTDGTYPSTATSTENKTGTTDSTLTLANLKKTDSTYNVTNGIIYDHGEVGGTTATTTTILGNGSRVIKLYYRRTYGTLTTAKGTNVSSVTTQSGVRYYYGATVPNLTATLSTETGYTITFEKWTSSNTTYVTNKTANPLTNFIWPAMPEGTEITLTASATKTANTNTAYKVEHYLMGTNGTYPSTATNTENKTGTTAASLTISDLKKTDSTYNVTNGILYDHGEVGNSTVTTTTINADGSLVIKLYYKRTYGTLTTAKGANVASVTTQSGVKYYYGAEVSTLTATMNSETGYTIAFEKWTSNSTYLAAPANNPTGTFTWPAMPENTAITITASGTKTANNYKVTYNYNNATGGNTTASKNVTYDSPYGTLPSPTRSYKITYNANGGSVSPTSQTGTYSFGGWYKEAALTNVITSTTTVKTASAHTIHAKWTGGNVTTPVPTRTGYTFLGWYNEAGTTKIVDGNTSYTPTAAITLVAQWEPNGNTAYKVEHYLMDTSGNYPTSATSTENKVGVTDATITLANEKKTNSTYNVTNGIIYDHGEVGETTATTTTILADGTRVIKLYYKRTYGKLTTAKGSYVSAVTEQNAVKYYYGATVPTLTATMSTATGYTITFNKWTSSNTTYLAAPANNPTGTFTWPAMPENTAITLTASGTRTANTNTAYKVEHYVMGTNGTYPSSATATDNLTGTTGATLTLANLKKTTSAYNVTNGIYYDHGTVGGSTVTTTTIAADGSRVIKLYYARTHGTLTTAKGSNIASVTTQNSVTYYYGATVPTLTATLASETGYTITFTNWTSSNTSVLANKTANPLTGLTWPAMANDTEIT